jgi:hypothetical protein
LGTGRATFFTCSGLTGTSPYMITAEKPVAV